MNKEKKCIFCGRNKYYSPLKVFSKIQKKTVNYYKCKFCKSIHQYPTPDNNEIIKYYDSYYEVKNILNPGYLDEKNKNNLFYERDKTLAEIGFDKKNFINKSNVELGCASGHFLFYMQFYGAKDIAGIDISAKLLKSIKINNVKLINGDLSKIKKNSIDNLFMFNILEHIINIKETMDQAVTRLKKDSRLILELPLTGLISNIFKTKWRFLMPDEHLHIPSIKGLKILLKEYNLKIIGQTRFGSGFTSGSIPNFLKLKFDYLAKKFKFGDRGSFLIIFKS
ncbi:MAG: class I SAM-dependent methyltransferase [Spirochaetes bacterium]|nr:class I SAM-dependent methyltransferase [Spirochaetota bacterium]